MPEIILNNLPKVEMIEIIGQPIDPYQRDVFWEGGIFKKNKKEERKENNEIKILDRKKSISKQEIFQLGMDWKSINMVGIELEGAWLKERDDLHEDLSFNRDDFDYRYKSVGEYTSIPFSDSVELFECIRNNYPDYAKPIHNSCAFHVHFSLKSPALYATCMNEDFYRKFLMAMEEWGEKYPCKNQEFWDRVGGKNRYCRVEFMPDLQASFMEKGRNRETRRTQLNYCYNHLRTIECRLFPVFESPKTAIYATRALLNFVEDYLSKNQLKEIEASEKIIDIIERNSNSYESINLHVNSVKKRLRNFNLFENLAKRDKIVEPSF